MDDVAKAIQDAADQAAAAIGRLEDELNAQRFEIERLKFEG